jgi:hypothetical protein
MCFYTEKNFSWFPPTAITVLGSLGQNWQEYKGEPLCCDKLR